MGLVAEKSAHVGIGSLAITEASSRFVDFLRPLITTRNTMFFKKPGLIIRWNAFFRPFEIKVWIILFSWILVSAFFLNIAVNFSYESKITADYYTSINSILCLLRVFSQQGSSVIPNSLPGQILVITSYLTSVVILTAYSGALISFIAVQTPRVPFHTLEDFVTDETYQLQVVRESAAYMHFANASEEVLNTAYKLMTSVPSQTMEQGLSRICNGASNLVHFVPKATMDLIIQKLNLEGCDLMGLPQPLNPCTFPLDLMIYQGLLGRLRKQLWPTLGPLKPETVIEVRSEQVIPIYMILIAGALLAIALFTVERRKKKSPMNRLL